ncbi:MAG: hypothetical protein ACOCP8_04400 [archaeon]
MDKNKKLILIYDLDKTLCTKKQPHETYADVKPIQPMIDQLNKFHDDGHTIIIQTARNMVTQKNDVGKVLQNIGEVTLNWLRKNNVKYDSIHFGKPYGDIYIDDKSCINNIKEIEDRIKAIQNNEEELYINNQLGLYNKLRELKLENQMLKLELKKYNK